MSQITITVNGQTLVGNTHQPLLEQIEQAGLQPEFQCRNGVCGACRCKLDKGEVVQEDAMAYLAAGEILTCRSTPLESVDLEFDYHVSLVAKKAANL
ncbi:2Fe-2S iron-sulfur cluster-binding protein [Enterovibrio sp. 27052020O]|uniref:2Fe-2S iron-sulfur cluster-binding protein n=1 Tax=Enterovibrio sp. 27052020O TaxID=3241166 RepID=UPI00388EDD83